MVRNIGGYSRAFGATVRGDSYPPRPQPKEEPKPEPIHRNRRGRYEIASAEKSIGALVSLALEGESLPLDVSRYLLDENARGDAVAQVMRALIRSPDYTDVDIVHAEEAFSDLRSIVIDNVKRG